MIRSDNDVPGEDGLFSANSPTPDDDKLWIQRFKDAKNAYQSHYDSKLKASWARNYRAVQNRHFNGSKYDSFRYAKRSKLFKPKTRAAVRKNNATAAASMFSTEDVVSVSAERANNRLHASTARFLHEALNYRLDRSNPWAGPNWFLTAIGARDDSQTTGICVSKQFWEYEEMTVPTYVTEMVDEPILDDTGMYVLDLVTGQPVTRPVEQETIEDQIVIVRDRPMITLIPGEHALIDITGDWRDPIQEGGFFGAAFPTRIDDVEAMIEKNADRNKMGGKAWRSDITIDEIRSATNERNGTSAGVRRARDDGKDRFDGVFKDKDNGTVWLYEFFYRKGGEDWHFWMLGDNILLSDPRPTIESYPEQKGMRPYVRGVGSLEPHKTHPMSPVESFQPLQIEINDITNLGLDAMKMAISPITKIRRGAGVDLKAVANRGPDAQILVGQADDVTFDRAPDPSGNSQAYLNILQNEMDELAGNFSGSSVQSNRMLNETVGGMQLLSQSASALTEFDLRVWVETWVEPVLAQVIRLIKHYESEEQVIAVAGERAGLIENIEEAAEPQKKSQGLNPNEAQADAEDEQEPKEAPITVAEVLDNLDEAQVAVKVAVGIGALDNAQRMQKFMAGLKGTMEMGELLKASGKMPNADALLQELWGLVGYKDADRFFKPAPKGNGGPPPEVQKEMFKAKSQAELKKMELSARAESDKMDAQLQSRELDLREMEIRFNQQMETMRMNMDRMMSRQQQQQDAANSNHSRLMDAIKAVSGTRQPQRP